MIPLKTVEELIIRHSSIEKDLSTGGLDNKLFAEKSKEYSDINEIINELENKLNSIDYDEIDFDGIDEKIYQYQQLSNFFEIEPESLYSIKEKLENIIKLNNLESVILIPHNLNGSFKT